MNNIGNNIQSEVLQKSQNGLKLLHRKYIFVHHNTKYTVYTECYPVSSTKFVRHLFPKHHWDLGNETPS